MAILNLVVWLGGRSLVSKQVRRGPTGPTGRIWPYPVHTWKASFESRNTLQVTSARFLITALRLKWKGRFGKLKGASSVSFSHESYIDFIIKFCKSTVNDPRYRRKSTERLIKYNTIHGFQFRVAWKSATLRVALLPCWRSNVPNLNICVHFDHVCRHWTIAGHVSQF